ncbi:type 2A phosphatase activator TIP41, partial [Phenoliferia sp. Uapishka_3]
MAAPDEPSLFEQGGTKGIQLAGWKVTTTKLPILNTIESDTAASSLHLPLPEICFGNNCVTIHNPQSGLKLEWDTMSALRVIETETSVKVAHAAEWARGYVLFNLLLNPITVLPPLNSSFSHSTQTSSFFLL